MCTEWIQSRSLPISMKRKDFRPFSRQNSSALSRLMSAMLVVPLCARTLLIDEKFIKCTEPSCGWFLWRTIAGRFLEDEVIIDLLKENCTKVLDGFTSSKTGRKFKTALALDGEGKIDFRFPDRRHGGGRGLRLTRK